MAEVTIYTRDHCGYCDRAKQLLLGKRVHFTELNISKNPDLRAQMIQHTNGGSTFPQIFIGSLHIGGCDDLHALEQAGKLDALLEGQS